ncbi:MAG TPA: HD domain-containing phosphohydrolase [Terriglobales bacterium]|nr:HD domain-containing phosphohydrolase [Terriglobales bacterium]
MFSKILPSRVPILYVILSVLVLISVVPMYFYSAQVQSSNRQALITNERMLQNTLAQAIADDMSQHQESFRLMQQNLVSALQVASGNDLTGDHVQAPELRALLENFVSASTDLDYATLLNSDAKGVSAGRIEPDAFLQRELEQAYAAARDSRAYNGQPLVVGNGKSQHTVMLVSTPIVYSGRFLGMIASVVDLGFLIRRLEDIQRGGLMPYVVDRQGRLIAGANSEYATGQDMSNLEIVRNFVDEGGKATKVAATREFTVGTGRKAVVMLGTYSPVINLNWAVIVQKPTAEAYSSVYEMQRTAQWLAIVTIGLSILVGIFAARRITNPLEVLTESSHAIARGDFSQRLHLKSRTEIGELATTFNFMSEELEHFVEDLKRAAAENRELFMNSIQMLAGAVDEKDPYTRGHSDRVTKYSVMIAKEIGQSEEFLEIVRVSAQLHDVGKIGIEDRILKKPGALTAEEFEIMKTHTTKGANILRSVSQLKEMIPGIELHHESLDGRGYPHGLKGEEIPILPRIIAVADTFDALTTNRPYQQAHDADDALRIIRSVSGKRLDPTAVAALEALYKRGEVRVPRTHLVAAKIAAAAVSGSSPSPAIADGNASPMPIEMDRT